jgi:hypothetical protein
METPFIQTGMAVTISEKKKQSPISSSLIRLQQVTQRRYRHHGAALGYIIYGHENDEVKAWSSHIRQVDRVALPRRAVAADSHSETDWM